MNAGLTAFFGDALFGVLFSETLSQSRAVF